MNPSQQLQLKTATNASKAWKDFKQSWQIYELASGANDKTELVRLATFLHVGGPEVREKYNSFLFENEEDRRNLEKVIEKFDKDCTNTANILAERQKFYSRKQRKDET